MGAARSSLPSSLLGVRSVSNSFETLLEKHINIAPGMRTKASASHNHLREFLASETSRDASFPRVLSIQDTDFLGGSFARHTKIWPLDDIDIFIPLDGYNLVYVQNGIRLPCTVVTDGVLSYNPLLGTRWMDNGFLSSDRLLKEFSRILRRHYPAATKINVDGCATTIRLTHGESEGGDGLGYDLVPCFLMHPDDADEFSFYLIPDGKNGWTRTNPRVDNQIADILQEFHNRLHRKIVKIVKYWNQSQCSGIFGSYYIELAICQKFDEMRLGNRRVSSLSEGVSLALQALHSALLKGDLTSWINLAPPVKCPSMGLGAAQYLKTVSNMAAAALTRESSLLVGDALDTWAAIFGEAFQR
jgi:hypothetical protein